jgi:hypothetical protein
LSSRSCSGCTIIDARTGAKAVAYLADYHIHGPAEILHGLRRFVRRQSTAATVFRAVVRSHLCFAMLVRGREAPVDAHNVRFPLLFPGHGLSEQNVLALDSPIQTLARQDA